MARDLAGKVVLITGGTDGLGRGVATVLAQRGARLLVHGRDRARGEAVVAQVQEAGSPKAQLYLADFAALADIERMADAILAGEPRLDVLVNNAGIIQDRRQESADGHELTFQVNYLAEFLLTHRLLPLLKRSAPARVVNVASAGQAPIDFDNVMLERRWDGWQAYLLPIQARADHDDLRSRRGACGHGRDGQCAASGDCREHVKMSGLRSTSNVRSGADALWAGWASQVRPRRP
jgi:NAD(P)-dependent dehydrogenase (short-subunit alcohol dehydrogenase family)